MRILVTGSKGIVGLKLVSELQSKGHSVFGVDIQHHPGEIGFVQRMSGEEWTYSRCDIGEYRQIERIIEEAGPFDAVYNCAAEFGRWNGGAGHRPDRPICAEPKRFGLCERLRILLHFEGRRRGHDHGN